MANCSLAIQVLPMGVDTTTTLQIVDEVIAFIDSKTEQYIVGSFETVIEGEYEEVMNLGKEAIKIAGALHPDIFVNLKVRYKAEGRVLSTDEKTAKYRK